MDKKVVSLLLALLCMCSLLSCAAADVYLNDVLLSGRGPHYVSQDASVISGDGTQTEACFVVEKGVDSLTLRNVNLKSKKGALLLVQDDLVITLEGENKLDASGSYYAALEQTGISVTSGSSGLVSIRGSHLTICGNGKLTALGGDYSAGIGGGYYNGYPHADIEIQSGEIHATGGRSGAGVGGGYNGTARVKISGGKVTAQGGTNAPGVGSGVCETFSKAIYGDVTISGGEVNATGGDYGAGVGAGDYGAQSKVNISGGKVTAQGGFCAAGIGGGMSYGNVSVNISGGSVNAVGGDGVGAVIGGSGIGGGLGFRQTPKTTVQVVITGGAVKAAGGNNNGVCIGGDGAGDGVKLRVYNADAPISAEKSTDNATYMALEGSPFASCSWMNITDWTERYFRSYAPATISFDANGGSGTMADVPALKDDVYTLPACGFTAPSGSRFIGWEVGGTTYAEGSVITVTGNMTIKACWQEDNPVSLAFDANGGTGSMSAVSGYEGDEIQLPACGFARAGHTFAGWMISGTLYQPGALYMLQADATALAQWTPDACRLTYSDGSTEVNVDAVYGEQHILAQNSFDVPEGMEFDCWLVNGEYLDPGDAIEVTGNMTITPVWKQMPKITFASGGGEGTMNAVRVASGESYVLPACGFVGTGTAQFIGWNVNGTMYAPGDRITVTQDVTVTAVWEMEEQQEIVSEGLENMDASDLPQELVDVLGNPEDVIETITEMMESGMQALGMSKEQMVHYDVQLLISDDDGATWRVATEEDFDQSGLEVVLDYPAGTNGLDYEFVVAHMFTYDSEKLGTTAGEIEYPAVTAREDGLAFRVKGLSPISVAWRLKDGVQPADLPQTGDTSSLLAWAVLLGVSLKLRKKI